MKPLDKNYLSLQFKVKMHQKSATEFQSFFEDIMEKAFKDFQKIRPYGNKGDGGNDGYMPSKGIYYQVYSPTNPLEKEAKAAEKFKNNFERLKKEWSQISTIKEFYFVFNDKYSGTTIELEKTKAELGKDNQSIKFGIFLPKDLEETFFTLNDEQVASLGFDIDSRNALKITREYLKNLEVELDRGNAEFVLKTLENINNIVHSQDEEALFLDYEIIEARALQKLERVKETIEKYDNLIKKYPQDPRAFLYLAEIYLSKEDLDTNKRLLQQAEKIDSGHWLLQLEKLIREFRLGNKIDILNIDESKFPSDPKIKADFYRLYSLFLEREQNFTKATSFIERAISLNSDKFSGYDVRLSLLEEQIFQHKMGGEDTQEEEKKFFEKVDDVQQRFSGWKGLLPRSHAFLNIKKLHLLIAQENLSEFGNIAKETFDLVTKCYLDYSIDRVLTDLLRYVEILQDDYLKLLNYLENADKPISDDLARVVILQFIHKDSLLTEGKNFFNKIGKKEFIQFIEDIKNKNYEKALLFIKKDLHFAVNFVVMAKPYPDLRKKILENLPEDGSVQKEKLLLLLDSDEGKIDDAFEILKKMDLSKLSYVECKPTLDIAEKKEAWDFVVIILEKLLEHEKNESEALRIKLKLFTANFSLENFPKVISIGNGILSCDREMKLLDTQNKEILLAQTSYAYLKRGAYPDAKLLIQKYPSLLVTFEAKISVEAEVYIKNKNPEDALNSIVTAAKALKRPSPEQYGSLFLIFSQIGNLMDFPLKSLDVVRADSFVKFKDQDGWFFIGGGEELDATKVAPNKAKELLGKKLGEKIISTSKYRSQNTEHQIENIFPIDKYILWQSLHHAEKLSLEGAWDKMEIIEVPTTANGIDTTYVVARLEDETKRGVHFFDLYCSQNTPLAFLATSEGGLTNAIGRITNERKGFINAIPNNISEIDKQKIVAKDIISGQPFYIDGTSALFLSEIGLLEKIHKHLPNLRTPQSVISLLLDVADKFRYTPGHVGHMRYSQGKISYSSIDDTKREQILANFENSIKILEANPRNIGVISSANKSEAFSEQKIPPSLSDACILAQANKALVLTEDFFYLQANEIETKKPAPKFCSALILVRVLCENGLIDFEEYLKFFSYLSSYRYKFLPIQVSDLNKAIFGDGSIVVVKPEELRKFNFPLTLSEEYGVSFRTAFALVGKFLVRILSDDSVLPLVSEKIFAEIVSTFPIKKDRISFAKLLLAVCVQVINKNSQGLIIGKNTQEKINLISQCMQSYGSDELIIP